MPNAVAKTSNDNPRMVAFKAEVTALMPKIAASVPEHVRPNQIIRTLFNAIEANPAILDKCTATSIGKCLIRAATYGLEISNGQLGHCYLVPYGKDAQLQLSYKGIKELVRRSGQGMIFMGEVREGDTFRDYGQDEKPEHQKADDPKRHEKPLTHAYAFMKFTNGFFVSKVMSRSECISHRDRYSKNWGRSKKADNPWHEENDAFPKMCQKTCVHALANDGDIPLSADLREAMQTVEGSSFEGADIVDAVPAPTTQIEQRSSTDADKPADVDWAWVDEKLNKITTEKALDDFRNELIEIHPQSKQELWDRAEEHREMMRGAK